MCLRDLYKTIRHEFVKFHALVLLARLYEHVASLYVDYEILDGLTMDVHKYAKREAQRLDCENTGTFLRGRFRLGQTMMTVCWKAQLIHFLADYSLDQVEMACEYCRSIRNHRMQQSTGGGGEVVDEVYYGAMGLLFLKKSVRLALRKAFDLFVAAALGAAGSALWPGWGIRLGILFLGRSDS